MAVGFWQMGKVMKETIQQTAQRVHAANKKWWTDIQTGLPIERNKGELIALIHSEISEWAHGETHDINDDKLPHRKMGEVEAADALIRLLDYSCGMGHDLGDFPLEAILASAETGDVWHGDGGLLRVHLRVSHLLEAERRQQPFIKKKIHAVLEAILSASKKRGYDILSAMQEKMAFNSVRSDHSHAERIKQDGKKF